MAKDKKKSERKRSTIKLVQLAHARGLPLPAYQTARSAGFDLTAAVPADQPIKIKPGATALVPTGLIFKLPKDTEGQVRPRSGLAVKHGVTVLNSPGTIDSDYRGEVRIILVNHGASGFTVSRGERIAQCILAPVIRARLELTKKLKTTARGAGGFGSTGVKTVAAATRSPRKKTAMASKARPARKPHIKAAPARKKTT